MPEKYITYFGILNIIFYVGVLQQFLEQNI